MSRYTVILGLNRKGPKVETMGGIKVGLFFFFSVLFGNRSCSFVPAGLFFYKTLFFFKTLFFSKPCILAKNPVLLAQKNGPFIKF
jgi:hypothetical protein